jgi:hypothetical protein
MHRLMWRGRRRAAIRTQQFSRERCRVGHSAETMDVCVLQTALDPASTTDDVDQAISLPTDSNMAQANRFVAGAIAASVAMLLLCSVRRPTVTPNFRTTTAARALLRAQLFGAGRTQVSYVVPVRRESSADPAAAMEQLTGTGAAAAQDYAQVTSALCQSPAPLCQAHHRSPSSTTSSTSPTHIASCALLEAIDGWVMIQARTVQSIGRYDLQRCVAA